MTNLPPNELENVRLIVRTVFEEMGLDMSTPDARNEARKDLMWIREMRLAMEAGRATAFKALVGLIVTGLAGLLTLGLHSYFGR